jgi:hypothetical protein
MTVMLQIKSVDDGVKDSENTSSNYSNFLRPYPGVFINRGELIFRNSAIENLTTTNISNNAWFAVSGLGQTSDLEDQHTEHIC